MAVFTPEQLAEFRRLYSGMSGSVIDHPKPIWNAAIQAIEDWWDTPAVRSSLSNAIDAATAPVVLTNEQKRRIGKWWLRNRFDRE